jgi:hypothetical protein
MPPYEYKKAAFPTFPPTPIPSSVPTAKPTPNHEVVCVKTSIPINITYNDLVTASAIQCIIEAVALTTNSSVAAVNVNKLDQLCVQKDGIARRLDENDENEEIGVSYSESTSAADYSMGTDAGTDAVTDYTTDVTDMPRLDRRLLKISQATNTKGNITFSITRILSGNEPTER